MNVFVPHLTDPIDWTFDFVREYPVTSAILAALLAHPRTGGPTSRFLLEAAKVFVVETGRYNIRLTQGLSRVAWTRIGPSLARAAGTPVVRMGISGVGLALRGSVFVGAAGAGAVLGAAGGLAIAKAGWGEEGYQDAHDLYTLKVSPSKYFGTLKSGFWDSWDSEDLFSW